MNDFCFQKSETQNSEQDDTGKVVPVTHSESKTQGNINVSTANMTPNNCVEPGIVNIAFGDAGTPTVGSQSPHIRKMNTDLHGDGTSVPRVINSV